MLSELETMHKVVGAKQTKRALNAGHAAKVFLAEDADPRVTQPMEQLAEQNGVPVEWIAAMKQLGAACGIAVGSAVAAVCNE